ncbi:hypothetical protein [Salimicrobium flavidum]|uniref:Uncharacterized protein n=1 Tax=Salimicrobium flavidum TaxID=570947 RepID=A0A1N7J7Z6_9BACI|nr:hypothetical protein [Salimicrobium flavidum]SIS45381.1 hypothetical protein SAMN05421687_10497 [Salimicrobium flavidum]
MAILLFLILLLTAILINMSQKRKELERRVERLEKINGVVHYELDTVGPINNEEQ